MKKTFVLAGLCVLVASLPAFGAYQYNWSTGFDLPKYQPGDLTPTVPNSPGQDGWFLADNPSYVDEVPMQVVAGAGRDGSAGSYGSERPQRRRERYEVYGWRAVLPPRLFEVLGL